MRVPYYNYSVICPPNPILIIKAAILSRATTEIPIGLCKLYKHLSQTNSAASLEQVHRGKDVFFQNSEGAAGLFWTRNPETLNLEPSTLNPKPYK